jgi:hypothetical protein
MDVWKTSGFTKDLLEYINHAEEPRSETADADAKDPGDGEEGSDSPMEGALRQFQQNSMYASLSQTQRAGEA